MEKADPDSRPQSSLGYWRFEDRKIIFTMIRALYFETNAFQKIGFSKTLETDTNGKS